MEVNTRDIELANFKAVDSDVFTGRPQGLLVRKSLRLDKVDKESGSINLIIPRDTTSFNPSFFLGLLFGSIKNLGIDAFSKKYKFVYQTEDAQMTENLQKNINDGLRNAMNSLNKNFGFDSFINNQAE